jgi:putative N6-adenine-specific DNA methylase
MSAPRILFGACRPGLEPLAKTEITALGGLDAEEVPGGVRFRGHRRVLYRVHRRAGLLGYLRVRVGAFGARTLPSLRSQVERLSWGEVLFAGVPRVFRVRSRRSRLFHGEAIAERVALGIASALGDDDPDPGPNAVPVFVRLDRDRVEISLETSDGPLHRRSHRQVTAKAPLPEDLARALIVASGWDPATAFVDPMCGAGTLLLEAAAMARGLDPGRDVPFALDATPLAHPETEREVAAEATVTAETPLILGRDRDPGALAATRANAERAGVAELLTLEQGPLSGLGDLPDRGALVTNPPWGQRTGKGEAPQGLHHALAAVLDRLPDGWRVGVLTPHRRLPGALGRLRSAFLTDQGGTKVRARVLPQSA